MVGHKKFGPAQNTFGPVKGQGISFEIGCWICGARYKWLDYFIYHESWLPTNPASFAILKKADWRFLSKFWGESNSRIFPAARTITLELSIMVFNRWAMVKTVQSANSSRIVAWIRSEKKNWGDVKYTKFWTEMRIFYIKPQIYFWIKNLVVVWWVIVKFPIIE